MLNKSLAITLIALFAACAMAQDNTVTPSRRKHSPPSFCTGKSCLYYAGDFDWNNSAANGVCDENNGAQNCSPWIAVKPSHDASVSGSAFVLFLSQPALGSATTPFQVRTGVRSGIAGKLVCNTTGSGTLVADGGGGGPAFYALVVKQFNKACPMKKGKIYFVSLQPQWSDQMSLAFVMDEEDVPPLNHEGWKTVEDDTYLNDPSQGFNYAPVWGPSGVCRGLGCDAFSIALTGKNIK